MKISDLVIVTSNKNKLAEINEILGTKHKVSKVEIPEIQSMDIDEVIAQKAKRAYEKIKKPVLVEDISVNIKALNGLPGPFIKFFLETVGTEGMVKMIKPDKGTNSTVTAAVAIYDGKILKIFKGRVAGTLSKKDRGSGGFGFDKIFIPRGYTTTFSQMPQQLKNKISHRAKALSRLKVYLKKSLG